MRQIVTKKGEARDFDLPATLVEANYCRDSGELLTSACQKDPRGNRIESGWFTARTLPHRFCKCHILCEVCTEGGICHGYCPENQREEIGLIQVERHFPKQVRVVDAEYVWRGSADKILLNPNANEAYFAADLPDFCGTSGARPQYNRSCTVHTQENKSTEDENECPMPWEWWRRA